MTFMQTSKKLANDKGKEYDDFTSNNIIISMIDGNNSSSNNITKTTLTHDEMMAQNQR